MKDPFADISKAFEPFFSDTIRIYRPKTDLNVAVDCVVFDDGVDEEISDNGLTSTRRKICITLNRHSPSKPEQNENIWPESDPPLIGDVVELASGRKFAVYDVDMMDRVHMTIRARSFR